MTIQAFWLLAGLLAVHSIGDFSPLATARMLEAKSNGGPLSQIAVHALVHTILVTIIIVVVAGAALPLIAIAAAIEFTTHFALDAGRSRLGQRYPALNDVRRNAFWYALGVDQLGHALVLVGLAALSL
jgi:hypothetical protein